MLSILIALSASHAGIVFDSSAAVSIARVLFLLGGFRTRDLHELPRRLSVRRWNIRQASSQFTERFDAIFHRALFFISEFYFSQDGKWQPAGVRRSPQ